MKQNYVAGDYITDYVCIYEITRVAQACIFYQPIWGSDKVFTGSIPIKNIIRTGIRKIFTQNGAKQVMEDLKSPVLNFEYNTRTAKDEVYQNQPKKIIPVLKYMWKNRDVLGKADRELMEQVLLHLGNEVAFVTKKSYKTVRKEVEKNLRQ